MSNSLAVPLSRRAVVRFGPFEVDLEEPALRKNGLKVRLQAQPFEILAALLEKPGAVVTRDELRRRLWPEGTFVDFEHGLNTAVTRLRRALGDSADRPRYLETLPQRGYRFIGSVERELDEGQKPPPGPVAPPRRSPTRWIAALALMVALGGLVWFSTPSSEVAPRTGKAVPLTTFRGREANPSLSPDGSYVAFTWDGEKQDDFDIYVLRIGSATGPLRLTTAPADELSPAWSPDGRVIAFVRCLGGSRGEIVTIPATGGPEQKVHEIRNPEIRTPPARLLSLDWSPDGNWIAAAHSEPGDLSARIYLFSLAGEMRPLTSPPPGQRGDHTPAFASDGHALAFSRLAGFSASEVYVLQLGPDVQPQGAARRLTTAKRWSVNPVWMPGGRGLLYLKAEHFGARFHLRIVAESGSQGSDKEILLDYEPSEIHARQRLVYSHRIQDMDIWRARIPLPGQAPALAEPFLSSTRQEGTPRYSPDGSKIAFVSSRSGSSEMWVSNADGSAPVRITSFGGPLVGYMDWSPDGYWLVFHLRKEGQADIYVIPAAGGPEKRLTYESADDTVPVYSRDGRWIYFASTRSGQLQIWRMPASGGEPMQITTSGGSFPAVSRDGKTVFYKTVEGDEIWSIPAQGGQALKVVGPIHPYPNGFGVTAEGIYYTAVPHGLEQRFIRFYSFASRRSTPVAVVNRPVDIGFSVSPVSKYILLDLYHESGRDLMAQDLRVP